jgi:hypothetical protein
MRCLSGLSLERYSSNQRANEVQTEKITKKRRPVMPVIQKKSLIKVKESQQLTEEDFLWDGKVVADKFTPIQLTQAELKWRNRLGRTPGLKGDSIDSGRPRSVAESGLAPESGSLQIVFINRAIVPFHLARIPRK